MIHDFENMEMTDNQFELYRRAKNWFYSKCHGTPDEIISELYNLLDEVVAAESQNNE